MAGPSWHARHPRMTRRSQNQVLPTLHRSQNKVEENTVSEKALEILRRTTKPKSKADVHEFLERRHSGSIVSRSPSQNEAAQPEQRDSDSAPEQT